MNQIGFSNGQDKITVDLKVAMMVLLTSMLSSSTTIGIDIVHTNTTYTYMDFDVMVLCPHTEFHKRFNIKEMIFLLNI